MAQIKLRRQENLAGDFYVDSSCIDCDVCRWMSPAVFESRAGQSAVYHQPEGQVETIAAQQALLACPTASIGTESKHDFEAAIASFPKLIAGKVYHCGFHDESSYGATSYLIRREAGNVLVDTPRFNRPLVERLEALGGVDTHFMTHRDDIGDHLKFREHFSCERVFHRDDAQGSTLEVEKLIDGQEAVSLADDLLVLPVPGHTKGSMVLIFEEKYLFSGDHVAWSDRLQQVYAFRDYCFYDWRKQIESMKRLSDFSFEWILPGHGRRCHFSKPDMAKQIQATIDWMRRV